MRMSDKPWADMLGACVSSPDHTQKQGPDGRLYTVTTIAKSESYGGTRTVVVCDSFERSVEIVTTNEGDIYENSYELAVIEAILPNVLYDYQEEEYWYRWDDGYKPIQKPYALGMTVCWGIG
jgi:hypothetical protein